MGKCPITPETYISLKIVLFKVYFMSIIKMLSTNFRFDRFLADISIPSCMERLVVLIYRNKINTLTELVHEPNQQFAYYTKRNFPLEFRYLAEEELTKLERQHL